MKTRYRYIQFEKIEVKDRSGNIGSMWWTCWSNEPESVDELGYVEFYPQWKCWVFTASDNNLTILSAGCLRDIADFMDQLKEPKNPKNDPTKGNQK